MDIGLFGMSVKGHYHTHTNKTYGISILIGAMNVKSILVFAQLSETLVSQSFSLPSNKFAKKTIFFVSFRLSFYFEYCIFGGAIGVYFATINSFIFTNVNYNKTVFSTDHHNNYVNRCKMHNCAVYFSHHKESLHFYLLNFFAYR